ncbi:MAG: acetyltransferase [Bacteroidales bacterium]|jgi:lipopolysaccharide O-acetyltransferase|nr:acetyltransferase [Bacteroidales bacterium]
MNNQLKNYYTNTYKLKLALWLLRTKMFYPKARLIKFPFDIRSKRFISLGDNISIGAGCRLEAFSKDGSKTMHFGKNIQINDYVHITSMLNVSIGDNVLMAGKIYISDCTHGDYANNSHTHTPASTIPAQRPYSVAPVLIGDNVWIGEGVCILPGTTIGSGCIIGANAVVKGSFGDNLIIVGVPARAVKRYSCDSKRWEIIPKA